MTSTPRRLALTCLAVPLLAALNGCTEPLATTTDDTDAGTSTGETGDEPTGGDPTTDAPTTDAPTEQQQRYFLHVDDTPPPPLPAIELDKEKTLEVFGEKAAKQIHLIDVDSGPLIDEVLHRILYACGDKWDDYDPTILDKDLPASPKHDCSLTELGKTFGTTETDRLKSPEYQLVRLLTMTPRNAQVRGTIMNDMSDVYTSYENSFNKLSFQDVLAASLFCPTDDRPEIVKIGDPNECVNKMQLGNPNEKKQEADLHVRPFISTEVLADTLRVTLLDSHPLLKGKNGMMAVTLYDALKDMQPLSVKYGPDAESGHPGVLKPDDENFTTKSDALTDQFKMVAFAESNLRRVEGIDASVGAGELYINVLPDEDTSDDVHPPPLNFDFNDPEKVRIEGLTPDPTVDMRMQMFEIDGGAEPGTLAPVSSCDGAHGDDIATCMANLPDTPVGDQYVWSQKVWTLEYIIAHAGHAALKDRVYSRCFAPFIQNNQLVACFAEVFIGVAVNNIRPNLQAQADFYIANDHPRQVLEAQRPPRLLLPPRRRSEPQDRPRNRAVLRQPPPTTTRAPTTPARTPARSAYGYANPGFFADAALTDKLSSTTVPGPDDSRPREVPARPGETDPLHAGRRAARPTACASSSPRAPTRPRSSSTCTPGLRPPRHAPRHSPPPLALPTLRPCPTHPAPSPPRSVCHLARQPASPRSPSTRRGHPRGPRARGDPHRRAALPPPRRQELRRRSSPRRTSRPSSPSGSCARPGCSTCRSSRSSATRSASSSTPPPTRPTPCRSRR
jgi:hypothetical protein